MQINLADAAMRPLLFYVKKYSREHLPVSAARGGSPTSCAANHIPNFVCHQSAPNARSAIVPRVFE